MTIHNDAWQLLLVDALFLCLAGSLGLWFRSWLKKEKRALDERLRALEVQQAGLERLSARLQIICQRLEPLIEEEGVAGSAAGERATGPEARRASPLREQQETRRSWINREERYEQARELLAQGLQPGDIARKLGLGMAEIELMGRILRHKNQG